MARIVGKGATWGIIFLTALILANAGLSYRNLSQLFAYMEERMTSFKALQAIDGVLTNVKDIETGVRGYVITGNAEHLEPYQTGAAALDAELDRAKALLADRPDQLLPLQRLDEQIRQERTLAAALIETRDHQGAAAAAEEVGTGAGKSSMDAIRETVSDIREREDQALQHWTQMGEVSYRTALVSLVNASVGALVLVGAVYYLIRREGAERLRSEQLLREGLSQQQTSEQTISKLNQDLQERVRELETLEGQLRSHTDYLQNQQHWLQSLLDLLPVPLLLIEPGSAKVTFANRAAHDLAGGSFPLGEPAEKYEQLYYCTDMSGFRIPTERMPGVRVAKGERLERFELNWHLPHGVRTLLINADSLPAMHGQQGVAVLLFQDISSLKQVETELRRTNQSKDALLAMLGHELRNPLAAITGSADVVATHDPTDPAYQASLAILKRHIKHLTRLIDDMLDLTRLTTGKIRLRMESVDLLEPLNHALQAAQAIIEARHHELRIELPDRPVFLNADRARLEQIFTNLLVNAAKYTDSGGRIELRASTEKDHAVVRIRDNGIGIDPAVIPRLFDLFAQVNPALDRSEAGLGIGLTVVRNLVDLHGGDVQAISAGVGKGSEFIVRLPLGPVPEVVKSNGEPQAAPQRTLRVLIVEDNTDIAHVMQALVKRCGHEPRWAATADDALEEAARWVPDVGLIDIGLPGMNGYELAARMRIDPKFHTMKLIALTGFGQQEDRRKSEEAGFTRHLVKPISLDTLNEVLSECPGRLPDSAAT